MTEHGIAWEGLDYQPRGSVDAQLQGYVVVCGCGEEFQHCAIEGAHDAHALHVQEITPAIPSARISIPPAEEV